MRGNTAAPSTLRKLWRLLTSRQRRTAIGLVGLMVIGVVLETLSVGLIIPALALMTQGDLAVRYPMLTPMFHGIASIPLKRIVVVGSSIIVGVFAVKTLYLAFLAWWQMRFVFSFKADLSQRLYASYLRQPYSFFLHRNSAQLINNAVYQVSELANAVQQGLVLTTEMLNLAAISALLLIVEPLGTMVVVGMLALSGWGFNRLTRDRILHWGQARMMHEELRLQQIQQGLGGVKEVKLFGREADFLSQFWPHNAKAARANEWQQTLQQLPRLWLELLAVIGLATLVIVMIGRGEPLQALLPTAGLFAAAAFRLMPSANRIVGAVQTVRYAVPVIDTLYGELLLLGTAKPPVADTPLHLTHVLKLDHVCFRYASAETPALSAVSLTIPRGASIGFIGGSGAGKSTLVDIILGLLTSDSGAVTVDATDIQTRLRAWQDQIGYVPQSVFLVDDTLRRNIAFGLPDERIDDTAVWRALQAAQLRAFVQELPQGLDTPVGERGVRLSGGQRQRFSIARALYHDPPVLVLDEATSSLDTATERDVMEAVRALKGEKTILIVAHRLSTLEHCDRIYRLEAGRLVEAVASVEALA